MKTIPYINLKEQHRSLRNELIAAVSGVFDNGNFILGDELKAFEEQIARYCGTRYAVGVNSGTDAMFLVLKAYEIGNGDEVITAPNSFLASASVIVTAGAKPVFVDVREDRNINPCSIEKSITSRTKAIMPVHLTGKPADMKPIMDIARRHNLLVIEDAAQAIGAEYYEKKCGALADAGCFSLHPLKTLNACGDAGFVTTDNEELYRKLLLLRNFGLKNRDEFDIWGYNSRLDSLQAAILTVKLKYLDKWIEERRKNACRYDRLLKNIVEIPFEGENEKSAYHTYTIQTERRDELAKYLEKSGVGSRVHYPIPIHLQKAANCYGYKKGDFPICEKQAAKILSLPIYQGLSDDDIEFICDRIKEFLGL